METKNKTKKRYKSVAEIDAEIKRRTREFMDAGYDEKFSKMMARRHTSFI